MLARRQAGRKTSSKTQIAALALIGAGLLLLGLVALVMLPKLASAGDPAGPIAPARVDYPAPELSLTDLQDHPVSLAGLLGQVVLVNNWATWCPPCKAEMPALQAFFEEHRQQGFTVVAIEAGEPAAEVAEFVRIYGLTFPVWLDPEQKALAAFRNLALPSSYVIDRNGAVRLAWSGAVDQKILEKYVTPLLEE